MQICHSLRCKQVDMSTTDRLISIFLNNTETSLSTLRGNAATLEYDSTSCMVPSPPKIKVGTQHPTLGMNIGLRRVT